MKDWNAIAAGHGLALPDDYLAKITPPLQFIEATFRPLVATIPHEVEPSIILSEAAVDPQSGESE